VVVVVALLLVVQQALAVVLVKIGTVVMGMRDLVILVVVAAELVNLKEVAGLVVLELY
jgi:hypothetical protein